MLGLGGAAVIVGLPPTGARASFEPLVLAEADQRILGSNYGSVRPSIDVPALVDRYMDGQLKIDPLISGGARCPRPRRPSTISRPVRHCVRSSSPDRAPPTLTPETRIQENPCLTPSVAPPGAAPGCRPSHRRHERPRTRRSSHRQTSPPAPIIAFTAAAIFLRCGQRHHSTPFALATIVILCVGYCVVVFARKHGLGGFAVHVRVEGPRAVRRLPRRLSPC